MVEAIFSGDRITNLSASIAGVDVRMLDEPYSSCGFPGDALSSPKDWIALPTPSTPCGVTQFPLVCASTPTWFRAGFALDLPEGLVVPLRLRVSGPASVFVWLNGALLARRIGNGDTPQADFYLLQGYLGRENELKLLCYDGRSRSDDGVSIEIMPWMIDGWSGNVCEDNGRQFISNRIKI